MELPLSPRPAHLQFDMKMPENQRPKMEPVTEFESRLRGLFLGLAIGDALGLPVETLSPQQIALEYGSVSSFLPIERNPFFPRSDTRGVVSDDTQLSIAVAEAILRSGKLDLDSLVSAHIEAFHTSVLGWGKSTKEAVANLARGAHWSEAGQSNDPKRGTGNGVAMKVAPIAAYLVATGQTIETIKDCAAQLALMTHYTSMAVSSGFAQIAAVTYCLTHKPEDFVAEEFMAQVVEASRMGEQYLPETLGADQLTKNLSRVLEVAKEGPEAISQEFGGGSCYVFHSLPFSYCHFLRAPLRIDSLFAVVNAGGDTDSNGSMVGALLGALNGGMLFPAELAQQVQGSDKGMHLAAKFAKISENCSSS